jgi:hypothetical protein
MSQKFPKSTNYKNAGRVYFSIFISKISTYDNTMALLTI